MQDYSSTIFMSSRSLRGAPGTVQRRTKLVGPTLRGSVDWKAELARALEKETYDWERRTANAVARRMEMFEWLSAQPSMRSYLKKSFTYGVTWAPSSWRG